MKALFRILPFLAVVTILTACGEDKAKYVLFGETKAYESWLWDEYTPQKMERYLDLEWNKASINWLKDKPITFEVFTLDDNGVEIPATDVKVYKNDVLCDGNCFSITTRETEIKFALEFKDAATEGEHVYFLKYIPEKGQDTLLDEVSFERFGTNNRLKADKDIIMNPLKEIVIWTGSILLIISILWYLLSRFVLWPSTPFSKVNITYGDGVERTIRMKGGYTLVCTSNPKSKDSMFGKIFKGHRTFEYNDFWSDPITINRGSRRTSISISGRRKYTIDGNMIRRSPIKIINENGDQVIVETT